MDDSIYNDFRNSKKVLTPKEEAAIKVLTPAKQNCCDHDFRTRAEYTAGWKYICVECGAKMRD